jgi:steroid delta-isomerase-like uncharacterized protein
VTNTELDATDLGERRLEVVRHHMESENRLAFDETLATFTHPRYELVATGTVYDGPDEVMGYYKASRTAFPDQRNEIHSLRHAGDAVITEFDLLGTHEGEFLGFPGTGREFRCRMAAFFVFEPGSDRIAIERIYFDATTILGQLGIAL